MPAVIPAGVSVAAGLKFLFIGAALAYGVVWAVLILLDAWGRRSQRRAAR